MEDSWLVWHLQIVNQTYFSTVWINKLWFYNKRDLVFLAILGTLAVLWFCWSICSSTIISKNVYAAATPPRTHPCCPIQHVQLRQASQLEPAPNRNWLEMRKAPHRYSTRAIKEGDMMVKYWIIVVMLLLSCPAYISIHYEEIPRRLLT